MLRNNILCFMFVLSIQDSLIASDIITAREVVLNDIYKISRLNGAYIISNGRDEPAIISESGLKPVQVKYFEFGGGPLPIVIVVNDYPSKGIDIFQGAETFDLGDDVKIKADKSTPFFSDESCLTEGIRVTSINKKANIVYITSDLSIKTDKNTYIVDDKYEGTSVLAFGKHRNNTK